jgi:hypothetical protein
MGWTVRGLNPGKTKRLFSLQNFHIGSGAHTASYFMGTRVLFQTESGQGVKLTTDFHLVQRLIQTGAISVLSLYTFMA